MTAQQLTVSLPGAGPAVLSLPQPLTCESLRQLEQALASTLEQVRCEMCGDNAAEPGVLEYTSWMPAMHRAQP
ncbi:MAG: hypothetical protein ABL896_03345 [Hylemonella sp.]